MDADLAIGAAEIAGWRGHVHPHHELAFAEHDIAAFVAALLRSFGSEDIVEVVGRTGIMATLRAGTFTGDRTARRHGRAAADRARG